MLLQPFAIPDWPWGGATVTLRVTSNVPWLDKNGVYHLDGEQNAMSYPGTVSNGQTLFVGVDIPATDQSQDRARIARLTGVLFDESNNRHEPPLFSLWRSTDALNPSTWPNFVLFNRSRQRALRDHYLPDTDIYAAMQEAIAGIVLYGMPVAFGQAVLVDGEATVASAFVDEFSRVRAFPFRDGVEGRLLIPAADIVSGVSFKIVSTEAGDNGVVYWELLQP